MERIIILTRTTKTVGAGFYWHMFSLFTIAGMHYMTGIDCFTLYFTFSYVWNAILLVGGASEEEATNFCNGTGTFMGYTRDNIFIGSTGNDNDIDSNTVDGAVSRGYISNVKYEKTCDSCFIYADGPVEVESFNFNCAGYLNMSGITDPDIVDGFCNNGGEFSGITYDDL